MKNKSDKNCSGVKGINMGEKRYIISDAAKMIEVESHVLRYWEEELSIEVPRNEMGHRYYTDFYIELFKKVKELKEGGFQLKAIKLLVPELMILEQSDGEGLETLKEELFNWFTEGADTVDSQGITSGAASQRFGTVTPTDMKPEPITQMESNIEATPETAALKETKPEEITGQVEQNVSIPNSKLEQFQMIITEVVSNALKENTGMLGREVSDIVSDNVIKEMDYLMHIREKQEEERFKKLDETIRSYQMSHKEKSKMKKGIFAKIKGTRDNNG